MQIERLKNLKGPTSTAVEAQELTGHPLLGIKETVENAVKEHEVSKSLSDETKEKLEMEGGHCVDILLEKETSEETAASFAKLLAQIYSLPGNSVDHHISTLNTRMDWTQWGAPGEQKVDFITQRANLVFREILTHYKLDYESMVAAWRDAIFPMQDSPTRRNLSVFGQQILIDRNFDCLKKLELTRPGSAPCIRERSLPILI